MIRKAKMDDAVRIREISKAVSNLDDDTKGFFYEPYTIDEVIKGIEEDIIFVETHADEITGFIYLMDDLPKYIIEKMSDYNGYKYVEALAVCPSHFKQGISQRLLSYAKKHYDCVSDVFLNPRTNIPSLQAHLKANWQPVNVFFECINDKSVMTFTSKEKIIYHDKQVE